MSKHTLPLEQRLLLNGEDCARLLSLGRNSWIKKVALGQTPRPLRIVGRLQHWRRNEFEEWVEAACPNREAWEAMRPDLYPTSGLTPAAGGLKTASGERRGRGRTLTIG